MGDKETLSCWPDLADNPVIFSKDKLEFIVVHLELIFLQEHDFSTLCNVDSYPGETFSFSDQSQDLTVEVDV